MKILIDNGHGSDDKWHTASGWSAYTTPGITRSDLLAADLYEAARKHLAGQKIRQYNGPEEPDFESNFYVLRHSKCPAVLTENLRALKARQLPPGAAAQARHFRAQRGEFLLPSLAAALALEAQKWPDGIK